MIIIGDEKQCKNYEHKIMELINLIVGTYCLIIVFIYYQVVNIFFNIKIICYVKFLHKIFWY